MYIGASAIQKSQAAAAAEESLTFLSRFHNLRQQKLQKNKSPTMSADTSLLTVLVHSTEAGKSLAVTTKHRQQPNRLERDRESEAKGGERGSSPSLCALLWNTSCPPPPSSVFPFSLTFAMTSSFPVWHRPLPSYTGTNDTHSSTTTSCCLH